MRVTWWRRDEGSSFLGVSKAGVSRTVPQVKEEALRGYKYSTGIGKLIVAAFLKRQT